MKKKEKSLNISDSILSSTKKLIGLLEDDTSFDLDIMLNINAALSVLYQLGVLSKPYTVTSKEDTYDMLMDDPTDDVKNQIKMYLYYKTKLGFDSSTMNSTVMSSLKEMIQETEYRLMISFNPKDTFASKENEDLGGEIQNE